MIAAKLAGLPSPDAESELSEFLLAMFTHADCPLDFTKKALLGLLQLVPVVVAAKVRGVFLVIFYLIILTLLFR